ncbi:sulfotransferase family protein [Shimia marina]|uniref:Sulfotransferase domain protein n=1 Tax=Shimia marina TaxID=321267 RepID=A0A0N7LRR1_9RHOB|nr:hypothetical protein [Shimia marina]CUH51524.1 hypothetical protein SHM7688_00961 [Shimia marina]SFD46994.1 hypothetical protein SAMN04488037_101146 [Shimia marina]
MATQSKHELSVIGFPKCGTSALMRIVEKDPRVYVVRTGNDSLEIPPKDLEGYRESAPACDVLAHKFVARAFTSQGTQELLQLNSEMSLVLCYRHPVKSLISWHNMHTKIAVTGRNKNHFAYKERDFYATASLSEYYERYAKERLCYDVHIGRLLETVPSSQLTIIAQEELAAAPDETGEALLNFVRTGERKKVCAGGSTAHRGYADKKRNSIEIPAEITEELEGIYSRTQSLLGAADVTFEMEPAQATAV